MLGINIKYDKFTMSETGGEVPFTPPPSAEAPKQEATSQSDSSGERATPTSDSGTETVPTSEISTDSDREDRQEADDAKAPETESTLSENDKLHTRAKDLINRKITTIKDKSGADVTTDEKHLRLVAMYANGFEIDNDNDTITLPENLPVKNYDTGESVMVSKILGQDKDDDGNVTYKVQATNADGTNHVIEDMPGDLLAEVHMEMHAAEIANNFKTTDADGNPTVDTAASKLVAWHARNVKGEDLELDSQEKAQLFPESRAEVLTPANEAIAGQIKYLEDKLGTLKEDDARRTQVVDLLLQLQSAKDVNGDILSTAIKTDALNQAQKVATTFNDKMSANAAHNAAEALQPSLAKEKDRLDQLIKGQPLSDDKKEALRKLAETPEGRLQLLQNDDFLNIPNIAENIVGKNISLSEGQQMITNLTKHLNLTEEQKRTLGKAVLDYSKKGLLWTLIAALAVGGGAVLLTGAAAVGTVAIGGNVAKASAA